MLLLYSLATLALTASANIPTHLQHKLADRIVDSSVKHKAPEWLKQRRHAAFPSALTPGPTDGVNVAMAACSDSMLSNQVEFEHNAHTPVG